MKKSLQTIVACLAFLVGVVVGELFVLPTWILLWMIFCAAYAFFLLKEKRLLIVFATIFVIGIYWNGNFLPATGPRNITSQFGQQISFSGKIVVEPDARLDRQKLVVKADDYDGLIIINSSLYPEYSFGDKLKTSCLIMEPMQIENFKYDKYLAKDGITALCAQARIDVVGVDGSIWTKFNRGLLAIKHSMIGKLNRTLAEPQSSLLAGILVGARQGMPAYLLNQFNIVGITHIIAISGYNITIIVALLMNIAASLGVNRKRMVYIIGICLLLFVILTGGSASVLRAAIMGFIVVMAKHLGRGTKMLNVMLLTAAIMVFFNPKILIWDAGFQLSFLSTLGLVYLSPILEPYFSKVPEKFALRENLTSTLSAIIMTLPLILCNFNRLSLVAPLANILVLPAIPISMFIGFVQLIVSYVWLPLGTVVGWFSWLVLTYVIKIARLLSLPSWAAIDFSISWWMMLMLYAGIGYLIVKKNTNYNFTNNKQIKKN